MFFPLVAPLFPCATVGPRSHQRWGRLRAAGQMPALSASMACFIVPGLFWAARRARFGAWAAERRDKNANPIQLACELFPCQPLIHLHQFRHTGAFGHTFDGEAIEFAVV